MARDEAKSVEKIPKSMESSSPRRYFERQSDSRHSQHGFDVTSPQMAGNLAVQQLLRSGLVQAKLTISQPGDADEQEADRVAEQVMRTAQPAGIGSAPTTIARKEDTSAAPRESPGAQSHVAPARDSGQALPSSERGFFEPRFGRDLSHVRVHTDAHAAETARAIQARAYTQGKDVVFANGAYAPGTFEGRKLLAHELTHVLQQGVAPSGIKINRQPTSGGMTSSSAPAPVAPPTPSPAASVPTKASLETQKLLDAALKSRKPADVLKIKNYSEVPDAQKFDLMAIVLDQWWVDNDDEYALEAIWKSFDERLVPAASSVVGLALWEKCIDAGADLEDIPAIMKLRDAFVPDVTALANSYLDRNDTLVVNESANAGIPLTEGPPPGPPTANQQQQMLAMKTAAASVAHAQEEMERSRQVYVGYSLGHVLMEAKEYWMPVTFDPFRPPQRATAPIVDLNDPSPMADKHPVLAPPPGPVKFQSYDELLHAYQLGMTSIRDLVAKHPLIYAVTREGKSATTQSFADADPAAASKQLAKDLKKLRADIALAKAKLGKELNPLDLTPLHEQLFGGTEANSKANWSLGLPRKLAKGLTQGHDNSKALIALGLESVSQMAFMLGGVLPGVGGVAASIVGLVAASAKAGISNEQYQAMLLASKVAVAPGTDLVTPAQVDEAKAQNDADQAALLLAIINTAAGIASTAGGWAGRRLGSLKKDAASNVGAPKSKALAKLPAPKESASSMVSGDTLDIEPAPGAALAPVQGARPKFFWKIVSIDPVTGECLGVVLDAASEANGTFRINVMTGDGIAVSGGQTRVIKGGQIQPPAPAIPSASGQGSPPTPSPPGAPGHPPGLPGGPAPGPAPGPSPLPGQALPGLPPAGGSGNAFPTPQPTGTAAEPNIGGFYPGMRQLPAGYPAYDHVRGGITTVKFTVESFGSPPVKRTVMNLTISGGEWLSDKTVLDAANATPEHIREVVGKALEDMANKSGRKAAYDEAHDLFVRVEASSPERVILHIQIPGDARARVPQLQTAAEQAAIDAGVGPGVPVEVRVMSWR